MDKNSALNFEKTIDTFEESKTMSYLESTKTLEKDPVELHREIIQKQRFGVYIKKKNQTGYCFSVVGAFAALMILPLQSLFEDALKDSELNMIVRLQNAIPQASNETLYSILFHMYRFADKFGSFHMGLGLFLLTDTQIVFQSMMLYGLGQLFIELLKIAYDSPRPYWESQKVHVYNQDCILDFAMPSNVEFTIIFYWVYLLLQFHKYGYINNVATGIISFVWLILFFLIKLGRLLFGTQFLFQMLITDLYGISYLVLCMNFDKDIVWFIESLGFDLIKSRELKFRVFFFLLWIVIINIILASRDNDLKSNSIVWLINLNSKADQCDNELLNKVNNEGKLGQENTALQTESIWWVLGLTFGVPYSLDRVDFIEFVKTPFLKRFIRAALGVGLSFLIRWVFILINEKQYSISYNDVLKTYTTSTILPVTIIAFIVTGPFLVVCKWLHLVGDGTYTQERS